MPVVYLDVLLAVNWVVDYLLLSAAARVLRLTAKGFRIVLGSLAGAISSCLIFWIPLPPVFVLVLHVLCAGILILIAFSFSKITDFLKRTVVLYTISALFSGSISALWALTGSDTMIAHNGVVYFDISPLMLTLFAVVSYAIIRVYEYITRRRTPHAFDCMLYIDDGCGVCECRALYDTGLHLREPFSGKAVVIVEKETLEPYVTKDVLYCAVTSFSQARVRLIPYHSLGADGLLPAFIPRKLTVVTNDRAEHDISGAYVAVADSLGRGDFKALIGPETI